MVARQEAHESKEMRQVWLEKLVLYAVGSQGRGLGLITSKEL